MTFKFYDFYKKRPPQVCTALDTDTVFVSQSEVKTSGLAYQLARFGMNTLEARMEQMRGKFGYADCTKNNSFAEVQNRYRDAVEYFEALPSEVRRQYKDNPEVFYSNIENDPKSALDLGFISEEQYNKMVDTTDINTTKPDTVAEIPNNSSEVKEESA